MDNRLHTGDRIGYISPMSKFAGRLLGHFLTNWTTVNLYWRKIMNHISDMQCTQYQPSYVGWSDAVIAQPSGRGMRYSHTYAEARMDFAP